MGLTDIAALAPTNTQPSPAPRPRTHTYGLHIPGGPPSSNGSRLDVARYLQARGVEFRTKDLNNGVAYLVTCPFDSNHGSNGESAVFQGADGKLTFECKHNSCQGRQWADFRDAIGRPNPDHYDPPLHSRQPVDQTRNGSNVITLPRNGNLRSVFSHRLNWMPPSSPSPISLTTCWQSTSRLSLPRRKRH